MMRLRIDGRTVEVDAGTNLAAALLNNGVTSFRRSRTNEVRQPLCGMGVCFECRVTIDGEPHQRSCLVAVGDGMDIVTGE